jgi:hypothetical protein
MIHRCMYTSSPPSDPVLTYLNSVNEIFNPSRTSSTYLQDPSLRINALALDKSTNYGVVRLPLLEHIYETLYLQRLHVGNTEEDWPHRILPYRRVTDVSTSPKGVRLTMRDSSPLYLSEEEGGKEREEVLDVDVVFVATGYQRDLHETLLKDARVIMPGGDVEGERWRVGRDYRVKFENGKVGDEAGVWLQGCCEGTHGVSSSTPVESRENLLTKKIVERYVAFGAGYAGRRDGENDVRQAGEVARGGYAEWVGGACVGCESSCKCVSKVTTRKSRAPFGLPALYMSVVEAMQ